MQSLSESQQDVCGTSVANSKIFAEMQRAQNAQGILEEREDEV